MRKYYFLFLFCITTNIEAFNLFKSTYPISKTNNSPELLFTNCVICHSKTGVIIRSLTDKSPDEIFSLLKSFAIERSDSVMYRFISHYTDEELRALSVYLSEKYRKKP
jgi:cytochrome c553